MRYRKKPIVIEAWVWDGTIPRYNQIIKQVGKALAVKNGKLIIETLEGDVTADVGDYVIKGVEGEFYPCKPEIFKKSYERVSRGSN